MAERVQALEQSKQPEGIPPPVPPRRISRIPSIRSQREQTSTDHALAGPSRHRDSVQISSTCSHTLIVESETHQHPTTEEPTKTPKNHSRSGPESRQSVREISEVPPPPATSAADALPSGLVSTCIEEATGQGIQNLVQALEEHLQELPETLAVKRTERADSYFDSSTPERPAKVVSASVPATPPEDTGHRAPPAPMRSAVKVQSPLARGKLTGMSTFFSPSASSATDANDSSEGDSSLSRGTFGEPARNFPIEGRAASAKLAFTPLRRDHSRHGSSSTDADDEIEEMASAHGSLRGIGSDAEPTELRKREPSASSSSASAKSVPRDFLDPVTGPIEDRDVQDGAVAASPVYPDTSRFQEHFFFDPHDGKPRPRVASGSVHPDVLKAWAGSSASSRIGSDNPHDGTSLTGVAAPHPSHDSAAPEANTGAWKPGGVPLMASMAHVRSSSMPKDESHRTYGSSADVYAAHFKPLNPHPPFWTPKSPTPPRRHSLFAAGDRSAYQWHGMEERRSSEPSDLLSDTNSTGVSPRNDFLESRFSSSTSEARQSIPFPSTSAVQSQSRVGFPRSTSAQRQSYAGGEKPRRKGKLKRLLNKVGAAFH